MLHALRGTLVNISHYTTSTFRYDAATQVLRAARAATPAAVVGAAAAARTMAELPPMAQGRPSRLMRDACRCVPGA